LHRQISRASNGWRAVVANGDGLNAGAAVPKASVATQVRVIVYSSGHNPAAVTSLKVMVGARVQLSVAVAVPVFSGNVLASHSMDTPAGQVMTGGVTSKVTVALQVLEHPFASVTTTE